MYLEVLWGVSFILLTWMPANDNTMALCLVILLLYFCQITAFTRSTFVGEGWNKKSYSRTPSSSMLLSMRDASASYWFSVGDQVRVTEDVTKAGCNLRNRLGSVVETWEKCDVDPTCCCAEQVDPAMAVRVEFQGTEESSEKEGSFMHYFAEEELVKMKEDEVSVESTVPFDGMSCTAFKLDVLQVGKKPRQISSYDPNATG